MARQKSADKLASKLQKLASMSAEVKQLQARQREQEKATQERQASLAGRIVIELLRAEPESQLAGELRKLLTAKLARASERQLFGALLEAPPAPEPGDAAAAPHQSA